MSFDTRPFHLTTLCARRPRTRLVGLLLLGLLFTTSPVSAQDVIVDDDGQADLPADCDGSTSVASTVGGGLSSASAGDVIFVCPGTYTETVTVNKSVTLKGNNAGTAGYDGSRAGNGGSTPETIVDAGTASPVDQNANIAFIVEDDDVTINGFELRGNQGVVFDPSRFSATNDGLGLNVQNNLIATDIVGVGIQNVTTTGSKSFTIANNQFELGRQSFDLVDSQEQNLDIGTADSDNTEGDENLEYTASVLIRIIDGDQAPTVQNNVVTNDGNDISGDGDNDGSFYGYVIDGLKVSSGATTIAGDPGGAGGTIQGTAQGIAVLDGQSTRQSDVSIENLSVSAMSGSAPNNDDGDVNFHAGVFTFVAEERNDGTSTIAIRNLTIEGLDFGDTNGDFSSNILLSQFAPTGAGGTSATQNVSIEGVNIQNTEHRGIAIAGAAANNITATITDDGDGDNTVVKEIDVGNDAHPIHSESGGSLTINNAEIINKDISAAEAVHIRDAGATITFGDDVTVNSNSRTTFGDLGDRAADAELHLTSQTSLSTTEVDLVDGEGIIELTGSDTLRVTDRLTLTSGTFDVGNGNLTLASNGNASTAFVSGSGSGILTGDVTVEWKVPSGYTGWQTLTAPVDAPLDGSGDALLSNMWTQKNGPGIGYNAANGRISNSSVFDYDETMSVGGNTTGNLNDAWFAPLDASESIIQGQTGRLVYFFGDRDFDGTDDSGSAFTLSATGTLLDKENTNTDVDLGLTYTKNDGGGDADGWNLVGNPFMAPIDWELMTDDGAGRSNVSRTVYIPKADGTYATYQADDAGTSGSGTNGGSRYISPFQSFFVKATGSGPSLTVKSDDKALGESPTLKRQRKSTPTVKLRMQVENSSRNEETVVHFSDAATRDASDGDAYQLTPFGSDYFYVASEIPDSSSAYEIQSLPLPNTGKRTVPLELASATARTYTLNGTLQDVPSDWTVRLKNRRTGATADLTRGESLTIELEENDKSATAAGSKTASSRPPLRQPLVASASGTATGAPSKAAADSARVVLEATRSGALPVELAEFEGQVREGATALTWTTASESNNAGFRVQRSPSGSAPWTTLGFVEGEGTTSSPKAYRFTDDDLPYKEESFAYRLKQVDTDGTVQYSDPITVERGAPSTFRVQSVFPNPVRSKITVRYEVPNKTKVAIALYDVLGRRVSTVLDRSQTAGRKKITVPVSSLSNGVHFLRLRTESAVETRKLVVVE